MSAQCCSSQVIFTTSRTFWRQRAATRAGGQPAPGIYARDPQARVPYAVGLPTLTLADDRICAITRFDTSMLTWSGLPRTLRIEVLAEPPTR